MTTKKFRKHSSSMAFFDGVPALVTNRTDEVETGSKHWYISFNSSSRDYGCETTALVLGQMEYFLILKGDHREGFQQAIDDDKKSFRTRLSRCLDYVRQNKDKLHDYSDPLI